MANPGSAKHRSRWFPRALAWEVWIRWQRNNAPNIVDIPFGQAIQDELAPVLIKSEMLRVNMFRRLYLQPLQEVPCALSPGQQLLEAVHGS